jgi:hypothetical protein
MFQALAVGLVTSLFLQAGAARAEFYGDKKDFEDSRAAALSDDVQAQKTLARLYDTGVGVPQSTFSAYVWYQIAAFHADVYLTPALDYLRSRLTPVEAERAERIADSLFNEILARKREMLSPQHMPQPRAADWSGQTADGRPGALYSTSGLATSCVPCAPCKLAKGQPRYTWFDCLVHAQPDDPSESYRPPDDILEPGFDVQFGSALTF